MIDEYMSISSLNFFTYKDGNDYFIVLKKLEYPDNLTCVDVSLSNIYINIVFRTNNDEQARRMLLFIISDYKRFSSICYEAYNYDDITTSIKYSFDVRIIEYLNAECHIMPHNNYDKLSIQMLKLSRNELLGRVAEYALNDGITFASLDISESEYRERFECIPKYIIGRLSVNSPKLDLTTSRLKGCLGDYQQKVQKKNEKKLILPLAIVIIAVLLISIFTVILWGRHNSNDSDDGTETTSSRTIDVYGATGIRTELIRGLECNIS